jgi:glyoxylase-like metal-dependent hydrolase (beta-lactamase superfamily II)
MKRSRKVIIAFLLIGLLVLVLGGFLVTRSGREESHSASASLPDLEYLKAVNTVGPPQDPELLFLLTTAYANANRQGEGVEFFSARVKEFEGRLTPVQKSLYLSTIGLLRAQHASSLSLLRRYGYVKETIAILEQAKESSGGKVFVVNWIAGIVHTELPGFFGQRNAAREELTWCVNNIDKAPHAAWLREVYYHLAKLARDDGNQAEAQDYLRRSGYTDFDRPITLATPFSEDAISGHAFTPRRIAEIVPGRVYLLSGFEFTEYYFVVSEDRRELMSIDAGTSPAAAKGAYEALRAYAPALPPLTTIFITHAHWDHVGGHRYFDSLNPHPRYYGRNNYQEEIVRQFNGPGSFGKSFFGEHYSDDDVRSYKPDVGIDQRTDLTIGGTRVELIPIQGGETHDAMFIYLPDQRVMFMGDCMMPYLGAPFVEEGDLQGLLDALDAVIERNPQYLLHGHEPITRNFTSPSLLAHLKTDLIWLREQVLTAIRRGDERAAIHQANLIPPDLLAKQPDAHQPYFILREHVIDRIYDQNVGYWQADLQGLDHLGTAERGELLVDYLGVSESQIVTAVDRLVTDGKFELAASLLEPATLRFPKSESLARAKRLVYLKLMEKNQNTDPFKFIIYSAKIGQTTPQINPSK